jgi:hypothetical protein
MNVSRLGGATSLLAVTLATAGCSEGSSGAATGNSRDAAPSPEPDAAREVDAAPESGQSCPPELAGPIDPTLLIDDLEDRDGYIAAVGGRSGGWWVYADSSGGTLEPPANAAPTPARILGGRCGSEFAMRLTGQGFTEWGAGMNIGFRFENNDLGAYDASRYSGIRFWARAGESHTSAVRVQLQDRNTYPMGGVCDPNDRAGATACYNAHGTALVPLGREWRLYEIAFAA